MTLFFPFFLPHALIGQADEPARAKTSNLITSKNLVLQFTSQHLQSWCLTITISLIGVPHGVGAREDHSFCPPCHNMSLTKGGNSVMGPTQLGKLTFIIIYNDHEVQSWKGPYGGSTPAPLKEAQWGIKLPNSAARCLNH